MKNLKIKANQFLNPKQYITQLKTKKMTESIKVIMKMEKYIVILFDETMTIGNSPNFQSVYVCSNILDNQIEFTDMVVEK